MKIDGAEVSMPASGPQQNALLPARMTSAGGETPPVQPARRRRYRLGGVLAALCLFVPGCGEDAAIPTNVKEAIDAGWTFFAVSEFDRSEAAFTSAAAKAPPGSREYLLAQFGLGNAYQHRKPTPKLDDAKLVYEGLAKTDAGGEIGGWSALALARMDHMKLYDVDRPGGVAEATTGEYLFVVILLMAVGLGVGGAFLLKDNYRLAGLVVMIAFLVGGIHLAAWAKKPPAAGTAGQAPSGTAPVKVAANLPKESELATIRKTYQRVMDEFPRTPAAEEAAIFCGETMVEALAPERIREGIAYLNKFVAEHPDSRYVSAAYAQMGNAYEMLGQPKEQLQAMIKADDNNKDPAADHCWWYYRIAGVAEKRANEPEIARKYYKLLVERYPTDYRLYMSKQGLKRLSGRDSQSRIGKEAATP